MAQAIKGGQAGQNGEFYKGGQFLPNTDLPKRGAKERKAATKKQQIAPYVWEVAPSGEMSIYSNVQAFVKVQNDTMTIVASVETLNYFKVDRAELQGKVDKWNAGQRWM
ncbi:MAG TPA: hypothetical protein VFZ66_29540 [Herpetosiphonaceae bacterium]